MNPPLVTVTICTYNGERYLQQTLDSVIALDYSNFEVVIVDDGSRDATVSIIEKNAAQHKRIRPFFRSNHGLAASRNHAFAQARGEWIAIIDQDDLCYPARLTRQIEIACGCPSAGLIFCNTHYIDERGEVVGDHLSRFSLPAEFMPKGEAANLLLRRGCFIDSEACFIKRDTILQLGALDESLAYACDFEYFIRAGLKVDFAYSPDVLAAWRIHSGQATKTFRNIRREVRSVYRRFLWKKGVAARTNAAIVTTLCRSLAGEIADAIRG